MLFAYMQVTVRMLVLLYRETGLNRISKDDPLENWGLRPKILYPP